MFGIDLETLCRPTATPRHRQHRFKTPDWPRTNSSKTLIVWPVGFNFRSFNQYRVLRQGLRSGLGCDAVSFGCPWASSSRRSKARCAFTFTGRQSETLAMKVLEPINIWNGSCVITRTSHYKSSPLRKPQIVNYILKNPVKQLTLTSSTHHSSTSVALFLQSSIISEHWSFRLVQTL